MQHGLGPAHIIIVPPTRCARTGLPPFTREIGTVGFLVGIRRFLAALGFGTFFRLFVFLLMPGHAPDRSRLVGVGFHGRRRRSFLPGLVGVGHPWCAQFRKNGHTPWGGWFFHRGGAYFLHHGPALALCSAGNGAWGFRQLGCAQRWDSV